MHGIFTHIWHDFMVNVGKFHTRSIWDIYIYVYINNINKSPASVFDIFDDCITNGLGSLGEFVNPLTFWVFRLRGAMGFFHEWNHISQYMLLVLQKTSLREGGWSLVHPVGSLLLQGVCESHRTGGWPWEWDFWLPINVGYHPIIEPHMKSQAINMKSQAINLTWFWHPCEKATWAAVKQNPLADIPLNPGWFCSGYLYWLMK